MKLIQSLTKLKKYKLSTPIVIRQVHGHSMVPVLPPGTIIMGRRWPQSIKVNSVIIFEHNGKEKIKRISEVRKHEVFVLGDHAEESTDSRHFGWISKKSVIATVFWPHVSKDRIEKSS